MNTVNPRVKKHAKRHLPPPPRGVSPQLLNAHLSVLRSLSKYDYDHVRAGDWDHLPFAMRAQIISEYRRVMRHVQ